MLRIHANCEFLLPNDLQIIQGYIDERNQGRDVGAAIIDEITHSNNNVGIADQLLHHSVITARQQGISWLTIGDQLGVTRQSVWVRFSQSSISQEPLVLQYEQSMKTDDPKEKIRLAQKMAYSAEVRLHAAVQIAHIVGYSWTVIGAELGVAGQAANQRFGNNKHN